MFLVIRTIYRQANLGKAVDTHSSENPADPKAQQNGTSFHNFLHIGQQLKPSVGI